MRTKATTYLLRNVDHELWTRVKIQAAKEGENIRSLILKSLIHYLDVSEKIFRLP